MKREEPMSPTTLNPNKDAQGARFKDPKMRAAAVRAVADHILRSVLSHQLRRPLTSIDKRLSRIERSLRKAGR